MKCEKGCLARDTMVLMADGSSKRIDEICVGDVVKGDNGVLSSVRDICTGWGEY